MKDEGNLRRHPESFPDPELRPWIRRRLLNWFARYQRDLPWRRDRDPYRIWVSEVMLQQTQVATVIPYFERFVTALPTLADLATAPEAQVLRLWEGLGYYRRARNLHRAARLLVDHHHGRLPDDPAVLAGLPGMGRYTVSAILSQAFDRRLPIVEANSQRVWYRVFGRRDDPRRGPGHRWLWRIAEALLPARRGAGQFNQAVMELGALVCTPTAPACPTCPLRERCVSHRLGIAATIPPRPAPPRVVAVHEVCVVVRRGKRVLLVQRPDHGRWSGLWEFPHAPVTSGQSTSDSMFALTGIRMELGPELITLTHSVTHHRITLVCLRARYRSGRFRPSSYRQARWVTPEELGNYPVSSPQRRLAQAVIKEADAK